MKVTVRADEIKEGDKLWGRVVCANIPEKFANERWLYERGNANPFAVLPLDAVVEVERPEPSVTVTITLPADIAEHSKKWPDRSARDGYVDRALGILGRAVRAELNKETER